MNGRIPRDTPLGRGKEGPEPGAGSPVVPGTRPRKGGLAPSDGAPARKGRSPVRGGCRARVGGNGLFGWPRGFPRGFQAPWAGKEARNLGRRPWFRNRAQRGSRQRGRAGGCRAAHSARRENRRAPRMRGPDTDQKKLRTTFTTSRTKSSSAPSETTNSALRAFRSNALTCSVATHP